MVMQRSCEQGFSLLELVISLALSAAAVAGIAAASRTMMTALQLTAAKHTATLAMLRARRAAYLGHRTIALELHKGARGLGPGLSGQSAAVSGFAFAPGITLRNVPARGRLRFYASGLADNATIVLGTDDATTSIVVNQRGIVH